MAGMNERRKRQEAALEFLDLFGEPFASGMGAVIPGGQTLIITNFTQSLGAELLTNGNFSAWTGDNPDGWTVTGESGADPEVSQVDPANLHGGGGTGAANLFSSATTNQPRMNQAVATAAIWHEFACDITARSSGAIRLSDGSLGSPYNYATVRTFKRLFLAGNAFATIAMIAASGNLTIDNASLKAITMNAVVNFLPTGVFTFSFTPGTTFAGQLVGIPYRVQNASNFMLAYAIRNDQDADWDVRLSSFAANNETNLRAVSGVGSIDAIRITVIGDTHQLATGNGGVFTDRGAIVSSSLYNTQSGVTSLYSPAHTPISLNLAA